jgi:hypothetical protein
MDNSYADAVQGILQAKDDGGNAPGALAHLGQAMRHLTAVVQPGQDGFELAGGKVWARVGT